MFSFATVHLPFRVQPKPKKFNLCFNDGATLVHQMDKTAFLDDYDLKEDTQKFEKV